MLGDQVVEVVVGVNNIYINIKSCTLLLNKSKNYASNFNMC